MMGRVEFVAKRAFVYIGVVTLIRNNFKYR